MKVKCINCEYMLYESPSQDCPYNKFICLKNVWDGIEKYEDLEIEIECKLFKNKTNE